MHNNAKALIEAVLEKRRSLFGRETGDRFSGVRVRSLLQPKLFIPKKNNLTPSPCPGRGSLRITDRMFCSKCQLAGTLAGRG
ncbi:hypothetical protein [Microcoleus sp. BROC3]|uniref:hypothetical protein n=1 Tax=Microcoleus sp. BROC3 TaxID=3055323 RepID=UPI002FD00688